MYGRGRSAGWTEAFRAAYRREAGLRYEVVNVRRPYGDRDTDPVLNRRMVVKLADLARAENARHLVTASPGVRLLAWFGPATGHRGDEVKVFEVVRAP